MTTLLQNLRNITKSLPTKYSRCRVKNAHWDWPASLWREASKYWGYTPNWERWYVLRSEVNKDWTCKDKDKDKDQAYKDQDKDKDLTHKDQDKRTRTRTSLTVTYCKLQLNLQSLSSNNNEHKVEVHNDCKTQSICYIACKTD